MSIELNVDICSAGGEYFCALFLCRRESEKNIMDRVSKRHGFVAVERGTQH
jgi:hypothetical protein